jgi:hypothetical protein
LKLDVFIYIRVAIIIVIVAWIAGVIVGFVPLFGWNLGPMVDNKCAFVKVIDMKYMVYFNFFGFVLTPLLIMFLIYFFPYITRIYCSVYVLVTSIKQIRL